MKSFIFGLILLTTSASVFADHELRAADSRQATRLLIQSGVQLDRGAGTISLQVLNVICLEQASANRKVCTATDAAGDITDTITLRNPTFFIRMMDLAGVRPMHRADIIRMVTSIECQYPAYDDIGHTNSRNLQGARCNIVQ